jgi:hypothetical protein
MITCNGIEMNHERSITELPRRAISADDTLGRLPVSSIARQRYCITALCNNDHCDAVEALMRYELSSPGIGVEQVASDRPSCQHLSRVVAVVTCTPHARTALFRLVNRLGLDAGVRSICWETARTPERVGASR